MQDELEYLSHEVAKCDVQGASNPFSVELNQIIRMEEERQTLMEIAKRNQAILDQMAAENYRLRVEVARLEALNNANGNWTPNPPVLVRQNCEITPPPPSPSPQPSLVDRFRDKVVCLEAQNNALSVEQL